MSDDFIPLNQSTPLGARGRGGGGRWQNKEQNFHQHNRSNQFTNGQRRGNNRWGNSPRYSSGGSDNNTSYNQSDNNASYNQSFSNTSYNNTTYNQDRNSIDAYLHPSMLEDPWAELRNTTKNTTSK